MTARPRNTLLVGDAAEQLRTLAPASIDCVVTSPPYYQLRDYGVPGQIGLEPTVGHWVQRMRAVFRELSRVLAPWGSVWINLDDAYAHTNNPTTARKGLYLAPERLLLELSDDGWLVRNKAIWAKPHFMPTPVTDRLDVAHEMLYLLTRQPKYYFDLDALREPKIEDGVVVLPDGTGQKLGRNPGDVWTVGMTHATNGHAATYPEALVRKPILASCPEKICTNCGTIWTRPPVIRRTGHSETAETDGYVRRYAGRWTTERWRGPLIGCDCGAATRPGIVLDPFFGTGTTGVVAKGLGRDWLGIELSPTYAQVARERLGIGTDELAAAG